MGAEGRRGGARTRLGRCVDLYVCTTLGCDRSTLCMASSAPFMVDAGVMSPPAASWPVATTLAAMWMICATAPSPGHLQACGQVVGYSVSLGPVRRYSMVGAAPVTLCTDASTPHAQLPRVLLPPEVDSGAVSPRTRA